MLHRSCLLLATLLTLSAQAQVSLPEALRNLPDALLDELLLTRTNMLDLIDTYEARATTPIRCRIGGLVTLDSLTADYGHLTLAPSTTLTFTVEDSHINYQLTTILADAPQPAVIRRTYTDDWQELAGTRFATEDILKTSSP